MHPVPIRPFDSDTDSDTDSELVDRLVVLTGNNLVKTRTTKQGVLADIDDGRFEVFFIKFDFVSYPDQDEILDRAAKQGIGTIVFKTNAGNRQRELKDFEAAGLSYPQATVRWALTYPEVASVAITLTSFAQLREMAAAVGTRPTRSEVAMLRRYSDEMRDRYCRICSAMPSFREAFWRRTGSTATRRACFSRTSAAPHVPVRRWPCSRPTERGGSMSRARHRPVPAASATRIRRPDPVRSSPPAALSRGSTATRRASRPSHRTACSEIWWNGWSNTTDHGWSL